MRERGYRIRIMLASGILGAACLFGSPAAAMADGTGTLQIAVTSADSPETDSGSLVLSVSNGTKVMNIHLSGKNGTYKQDLPDGNYTVKTVTYTANDGSTPDMTKNIPRTFAIEDGSSTEIKLSYDVKDDESAASSLDSESVADSKEETPKASPIVESTDSGTDSDTESIVTTNASSSAKPITEAKSDTNKSFWMSLLKKNLFPLLALGVCFIILGIGKLKKKKQIELADRAEDQEIEEQDMEDADDGDYVNDSPEDVDDEEDSEEDEE